MKFEIDGTDSDIRKPMDYTRKFPFMLVLVVVIKEPE